MTQWNGKEKIHYREMVEREMLDGCRWLSLLAVGLFPAFSFLDYYSHRHLLVELSIIRYSTTLMCFFTYLYIKNKEKFRHTFALTGVLVLLASLSVTLMCVLQGGYRSPYYAGINLVTLAAILIMPIGPRKLFPLIAASIGIYLIGIFIAKGLVLEDTEYLVNNICFLISNGIIGLAASHLKERMRKESYGRYLQIEKARFDLKRSRDMLQAELKSEQGNVEMLVREIRDRKVELEKALSLRDEFISLASHELNTPLTALKLQTQMAKRKAGVQRSCQELLEKTILTYELQLQRLIRIVSDMLDISRIASGRLELERSNVDLVEAVQKVVDVLPAKGVDVFIQSSSAFLIGHWDNFKIEQVILNLLTNAVKYGNQKPVHVKLYKDGSKAFMEVIDEGIGIAPVDQLRVFERFERAVTFTEFSGLGLGLYIAKQIVHAHDGRIDLESEPGKGSMFKVELPLFQQC